MDKLTAEVWKRLKDSTKREYYRQETLDKVIITTG